MAQTSVARRIARAHNRNTVPGPTLYIAYDAATGRAYDMLHTDKDVRRLSDSGGHYPTSMDYSTIRTLCLDAQHRGYDESEIAAMLAEIERHNAGDDSDAW